MLWRARFDGPVVISMLGKNDILCKKGNVIDNINAYDGHLRLEPNTNNFNINNNNEKRQDKLIVNLHFNNKRNIVAQFYLHYEFNLTTKSKLKRERKKTSSTYNSK